MRARLDPSSPPGTQIHEYLLVEIDHALARARCYQDVDENERVDAIRQIRKATKRARAAVSLLEPSVGGRFRTELRGCARQLSDVRDQDVVRETLERLVVEDDALRRHLRKASLLEEILEVQGPEESSNGDEHVGCETLASVQAELASVRARASDLGRGELRWKFVIGRVSRSWRRARRAFRSEWSSDDTESLHSARKAVVRLQSQLALVERIDPGRIKSVRRGLKRLARQLGLDRDAVLVLERAELVEGSGDLAAARKRFMDRMQRGRRRRLQRIRRRGKCLLEPQSESIRAKMRRSIKHIRRDRPA